MAWFRQRSEHHYHLVYPGPVSRVITDGSMVTKIEAYGPAVTKDHSGYRILINYLQVFRIIRKVKPEVLEAGDPWLTGIFCLALKKSGIFKGKLVSFYHSDPIPSYLEPWAKIGRFRGVKKILAALAGWLFYKLQNGYDLTAVSSRAMEAHLHAKGIQTVVYLPFGVPSLYLAELPKRSQGQVRVLYAGRLDRRSLRACFCRCAERARRRLEARLER